MVLINILITTLLVTLEKCECGDSCEMKDGEEGICHKSGWCKPATMDPDCMPEGKRLTMIAQFCFLLKFYFCVNLVLSCRNIMQFDIFKIWSFTSKRSVGLTNCQEL